MSWLRTNFSFAVKTWGMKAGRDCKGSVANQMYGGMIRLPDIKSQFCGNLIEVDLIDVEKDQEIKRKQCR